MKIKESVESGEYFKQAIAWYESQYLSCIAERSIFALLFVSLLINLLIIGIKTYILPFVANDVAFAKYINSEDDVIVRINHLGLTIKEDPQISVSRYLVNKYVTNHQSFNVKNIAEMTKYVQNQSSRKVYKKFQDYLSISNPKSPVLKYQMHTKRIIDVRTVLIYSNMQMIPERAKVIFRAVYHIRGKNVRTEMWEANVHFTLSDINLVAQNFVPLSFVVTDIKFKKTS